MLEHRILWRRQIAHSIPLKQRLQDADVGHRFDCEYRLDQPLRLVGAVRSRASSIVSRRDIGLDGVPHTAVTRSRLAGVIGKLDLDARATARS